MDRKLIKYILGVCATCAFIVNGMIDAQALNLCPSSQNPASSQSIRLQYKTPSGVPDTAGSQSTDMLEIHHQPIPNLPIPGLNQKNLVPQNQAFDSCAGIPGQAGSTGYAIGGECDGNLFLRVTRDGMSIGNGSVTVNFLEVNMNVTQVDVTNVFTLWPSCGTMPNTTVPCQPNAPNVALFQNLLNVVGYTRKYVNVINTASVVISDIKASEITSNISNPLIIPGVQNDEYLHLMTAVGAAPPDSQWFAFATLNNGVSGSCVQVSKLLPLKHL